MKPKQSQFTRRELKIEDVERASKDYKEVDDYLKSVYTKFTKEPLNLENLDKAYTNMNGVISKPEKQIQE
jgi:hypothetical protein